MVGRGTVSRTGKYAGQRVRWSPGGRFSLSLLARMVDVCRRGNSLSAGLFTPGVPPRSPGVWCMSQYQRHVQWRIEFIGHAFEEGS